jgi:hypothetical protein
MGKDAYVFRTPALLWVSGAFGFDAFKTARAAPHECAWTPAPARAPRRRAPHAPMRAPTCPVAQPSPLSFPFSHSTPQLPQLKTNRVVKLRNVNMRPVAPAMQARRTGTAHSLSPHAHVALHARLPSACPRRTHRTTSPAPSRLHAAPAPPLCTPRAPTISQIATPRPLPCLSRSRRAPPPGGTARPRTCSRGRRPTRSR